MHCHGDVGAPVQAVTALCDCRFDWLAGPARTVRYRPLGTYSIIIIIIIIIVIVVIVIIVIIIVVIIIIIVSMTVISLLLVLLLLASLY